MCSPINMTSTNNLWDLATAKEKKRARSKREIAEIYFTFQEIPFLILPSILIKNKAESLCF
ncbi:hypothetical protein AOG55_06190 [Acidiplasma cupricumulans]|uniref:Uncharacterized protein n=1 Tax=Acidiplasma cupricumulans TaxID=312540 RepID=A0A0Q0RTC4_9ARCH|nr:hypothetical protein AOG55_06190 [Acidiplasma cupricumulans]